MANKVLGTLSFLILILSLVFFFLPVLFGSSSVAIFFLISFGLLLFAFFTSIFGVNKGGSGLSVASLVISILFLLFLVIGGALQA